MQDFLGLYEDMPQYQKCVLEKMFEIYNETGRMPIVHAGRWAGKTWMEEVLVRVRNVYKQMEKE